MKSDLPYMMPTETHFIDTMKRLNIKLSDKVVCYETGSMGLFSYRVAWMFEAMGHPNVHVLNGGFLKWRDEGKPLESTDDKAQESQFAYKLNHDAVLGYDSVKQHADSEGNRNFTLIDARMPEQYSAGHIPGSINIPAGKFMADTTAKTLKTAAERQQVF